MFFKRDIRYGGEKIFRFIVSNFLLRFSIACLKSIQIVWSRYHSSLWFLNIVCFTKNIHYLIRYIKITKLRQPEKISFNAIQNEFKYLIKGDITILNLPTEEEKNLTIIMSEPEVYHSTCFIWINRYWYNSVIYGLLSKQLCLCIILNRFGSNRIGSRRIHDDNDVFR